MLNLWVLEHLNKYVGPPLVGAKGRVDHQSPVDKLSFKFFQAVKISTPARKRLMRDFKRLQQDPPAGISGASYDNNIML
ncbi:hypothetical protein P3L10_013476 [Capsicum annuum]